MHSRTTSLLAHGVLALCVLAQATPQQVERAAPAPAPLRDGSFESTQGAPTALPTAWSTSVSATNGDGDATSEALRDESVARGGSASLRLSGDADTMRWMAAVQTVEGIRPGHRYRLSAWLRTEGVHKEARQYVNCNVFAQFKDAEGQVIRDADGYPVVATRPLLGTHDWTQVERILRAPAGAATATIGCFLSCSGTAWFDDVAFQPLVTPDWQTLDTGRYVYHWEHEGVPPQLIIDANQAFLEELEKRLQTSLDRPVQYFYYMDNARKGEVTGQAGNAHVEGSDEIHSIFWSDRHEVVHLLTRRWTGRGTALLGEGLAVHLSGGWHAEPVDVAARTMQRAGTLLPLSELVSTTGFRAHDDLITYPEAGSFVQHLLATYGLGPFRELYTATPLDPDPAAFDALLRRAYGKDLAALESEWLAALTHGEPSR